MHRALPLIFTLLALLPRVGSAGPIETRAYVVTTDFENGGLSVVDLATRAVTPDVAPVHSDATLRWWGGRIYVVNRFGQDNVQVIDPAQGYATLRQFSTGNGTNPQDIAVVSPTKAYVSCLGSSDLLIVDPQAGAITATISLAAFGGADGLPEAARMTIFQDRLFVALQRLDNSVAAETSLVAVVDLVADTLIDIHPGRPGVQAIPLVGRNPVTTFEFDPYGGRLLIGCAGLYRTLDGGIEAIPVLGGDVIGPLEPLYESAGFAITEQELGGDLGDLGFLLPGHSFAIVSDASFNTAVRSIDLVNGVALGTVYSPGGFSLSDLAVSTHRDELWVCDTSPLAPGLHVFRAGDGTHLAGPLPTGLPPYQIVFDRDEVPVGVERPRPPGAPTRALALSEPWPLPARDRVSLALQNASGTPATVEVLDLAGRRVRRLAGAPGGGETRIDWDLRDETGNRAAPGVYVVHARAAGMSVARRIVVSR
jgi:hypothetical protein